MSWMGTLPQASTRLMDFKWNCSPDVMPKNLLCNLFAFLYMTYTINVHCHGCLLLTSQKKETDRKFLQQKGQNYLAHKTFDFTIVSLYCNAQAFAYQC
uniref:Uncharacterized protein n=1 Tax=Anguilla anguilla TaxID=7936 RepID=A0A0E9X6X5_ANGAN